MKLSCIIVDDEPLARKILKKYVDDLPYLECAAECKDAVEALAFLQKQTVDLILLDINMPKISGIEFARSLRNKPMIIFTTAYPEYAVEGFELEAIDYLVKPIEFDRFLTAINKCLDFTNRNTPEASAEYLFIKSDRKYIKVHYKDLLFVQAYGDYIKIFTKDKTLLSKDRLANMAESLPKNTFIKVHRSYIVNVNAISYLEGKHLKIEEHIIPVSDSYINQVMQILKGN